MRAAILLGLVLGGVVSTSGQTGEGGSNVPVRSLTLQQCIEMALEHNLDLQIQHVSTDIAEYDLSGAYGAYDPRLSFEAGRGFVSEPGDFSPHKFNLNEPYELQSDKGGASLSGQLPFGLSYDVGAQMGYKEARTDFRLDPEHTLDFPGGIRDTNNYFADTRIALRQHLLKDFWIDSDRATLLIRGKDLQIARQALRFEIMKTVLAVETGYYGLIAGRGRVAVQRTALGLRQQFLAETRRRVALGDLPPLDVDQAQTQVQNTLTALAAARESYAAEENAFKAMLTDNFRAWVDTELAPADTLLPVPPSIDRAESFDSAMKNRPDLAEARMAVEKRAVAVRFGFNQLFPALDLVGRYGSYGDDADFSKTVNNSLNFRDPEYFYGVVLSFPLSNLQARNGYHASLANRRVAELQLRKAEQAVLVQVADWVNRVRSRFTQVGSTRKASGYAEAALAAEEKKLANGLSTSFVVLQLQQTLIEARTAQIQALADYYKALAQLAFADGSILRKRHLIVR
jgi:outer membrane protein